MTEFTGERVIPGQVEDDLWAEHLARYAFAARFAAGKRVLDVGCGVGYGAAELALTAREVTGVDVSAEAVDYAAENYARPTFLTASAEKLPFEAGSFDLVTAFELIEHLDDWRSMLGEARRVLHPAGVLIVSTPNKSYYAETRGAAGPNPYHRHEFEYAEFCAALKTFFPQVRVLLQDRMESFGFYEPAGAEKAQASIVRSPGVAAVANFFIGVCSGKALPKESAFVYVPRAANLLREREAHISKLKSELNQVWVWLEGATAERDRMLSQHAQLEEHLKDKNRWAAELEATLKAAQERVVELQGHIAAERPRVLGIIEQLEQAQARIVELQEQYNAEQARAREAIAGLNAELSEEQERAREAIDGLTVALSEEQTHAQEAIAGLTAALSEEQAQAGKAIAGLTAALSEEQARAQEAIAGLTVALSEEQTHAQEAIAGLTAALSEEQAQAGKAIAGLTAALSEEQVQAQQAIAGLTAALSEEQARAQEAIAGLSATLSEEQARALENITRLEATVVERTQWAQGLDAQVQKLHGELKVLTARAAELTVMLTLVRESRWVKAGRAVGLGPKLPE